MDHGELRAKTYTYFKARLAEGMERRSRLGPLTAEEGRDAEQHLEMLQMPNTDYWRLLGEDNIRPEVTKFIEASGISAEECRKNIWMILDEIRKAKIGATEALLDHARSLDTYDFSEPQNAADNAAPPLVDCTPSEHPDAPSGSRSELLLTVLFAKRLSEAKQSGEWSQKLIDDYQKWTGLFIELHGDRPITDYRKVEARDFKTALLSLPTNRGKLPQTRGLPAREAIAAAEQYQLPTLSNGTINKALGRMQATWKWAAKQLDEEVIDIFGPMKLPNKTNARDQHDPFSTEQLKAIFNSPVFTGCKSTRFRADPGPTDMSATSWFWLPLLGLWTGARLNELCQLRVDDLDEEEGIPFMHVHEADETQRVKFGKKRIVPLHPELIRLGFLRFVEVQRQAGHVRLFPDLKLSATGYYSDQPSKDFSRLLKQIDVKTAKTSFHSLRHCFKDACRNSGVAPDINDILMGHALQGMGGRYGHGKITVQNLHDAICKISYKKLSLGHIRGHP